MNKKGNNVAYPDVNRIVLTGRIYGEPKIRLDEDGEPYTMFVLARVSRRRHKRAKQVDLFRLRVKRKRLVPLCNRLLPDTRVLIQGRLQTLLDDTLDGTARYAYEIIVRRLIVLEPPQSLGTKVPRPRQPKPTPFAVALTVNPHSTP